MGLTGLKLRYQQASVPFMRAPGQNPFPGLFQLPGISWIMAPLPSSKPAVAGGSHRVPLSCLPPPHVKTPVIALGPPGLSRILSPPPGQLIGSINSICRPNSLLPGNLTYSWTLRSRTLGSHCSAYSVHCRKFRNTEKT